MAAPLPFTGERFTPECAGGIWYEHWHRYVLISDWVKGKSVLDAACGEGYGSAFLSGFAGQVIGIDVSPKAIAHACDRYGGNRNLTFIEASATSLPIPDASIDVVVSFETIEHLHEQEIMLNEFRRVLRPGGFLILSAPNRPVYSDEMNFRNEHHVREHDQDELRSLLSPVFPQSHWYAQRLLFNSVLWSMQPARSGQFASARASSMHPTSLAPVDAMPDAMYFLVVCGAVGTQLPKAPELSLFADCDMSVLKQYEHLMSWQWEARDKIARLDSAKSHLEAELQRLDGECRAELASRMAQLEQLRKQVDDCVLQIAAADRDKVLLQDEMTRVRDLLHYRSTFVGWLKLPFHRLRRLLGP